MRLKGYVILERRLVTPAGEIDIVARRGLVLVIVEVKARQLLEMEGIVSAWQKRRLVQAAAWHIEDAWRADDLTIAIRI